MEQQNPQLRNIANQGDVLKHAALTNLAKMLLLHGKSRLAYIETHAFLLEAKCPNPEQWAQGTQAEVTKHSTYNDYFNSEKRVLDNLPYRCSAGLVLDELKKGDATDPVIILAEKEEATREVLKDQLLREQISNCTVLEDAADIGTIKLPHNIRTILILVDPFELDAETWNGIIVGLSKIIKPEMDVVLELFTFDKENAKAQWPAPPAGTIGPVSVMHRQPYHLAVYATGNLKVDVSRVCHDLGWSSYG